MYENSSVFSCIDIERYSDKYQVGSGDNGIGWHPDWKRFPKELRIVSRKARPPKSASMFSLNLFLFCLCKSCNNEKFK